MLHRLNPPGRFVEESLFALIDRQRQLLEYAHRHDQYDELALHTELGMPFAKWLSIRRNEYLLEKLKLLIVCPAVEKASVLEDFDQDQEFWAPSNDATFQFAFSTGKTTAHRHAKECLNAFYEQINSSALLLPTPQQFKREDIVNGYIAENPFIKMLCPCCDGNWSEQASRTNTPYTLEHFFHKEEHPTICLNPYNLIPVCTVCNSRRGNKEVLKSATGSMIAINKIFHPLFRPARECVELQYYSGELRPVRVQFVNLPTQLEDWREAIEIYDLIYEIPKRWQERWDEINDVIGTHVLAVIEAHWSTQQQPITLIDFERMVSGIISALKKHTGRYQYPAQRWLVWAKQYQLERLYEAHVEARGLHRVANA